MIHRLFLTIILNYLNFSEAMVAANNKLTAPANQFSEALTTAVTFDKDNGNVRATLNNFKEVLKAVQAEVKGMNVPNDPTAKDLHDAELKFLAANEHAANNEMAEVVKLIEEKGSPMSAKVKQIDLFIDKMKANGKRDQDNLEQAQSKFAAAHGITLR